MYESVLCWSDDDMFKDSLGDSKNVLFLVENKTVLCNICCNRNLFSFSEKALFFVAFVFFPLLAAL
jgi:hypothetical protein